MPAAVFFDLDRTLLAGASGPVISKHLREVGLLPERSIPGEGLVFGLFNLVGENRPSMMLTRQMAKAAAGWSADDARAAGEAAAEELDAQVQPYARVLIDSHHEEGRAVVLATTTPRDLIEPLARRLGLDGVIATRYEERNGHYTGRIDGPFVWGKGKLDAVRAWASEHDTDLSASWAYSDSYFDAGLLGAVGNPVAANPDPRLAVIATLRRWPIIYLDVPPGVPKVAGLIEPQKLLMPLVRPELVPFARIHVEGTEHIPDEGPAILAGNHRSYFDPLAIGHAVARAGRPARFLGKKEVIDAPLLGDLARAMGGIRVDRGTGSDEPLKEAAEALAAGEMVAIMPQGTIPRGRAFFDPVLRGRWGGGQRAAHTRAPGIPNRGWGT
ncbi:MAG: HAD-IB family hydrolase, partial [Acidimicrobiia bacterium]|nr:HAD-IB family hydrolase [Acidimicrobiia bacterium]